MEKECVAYIRDMYGFPTERKIPKVYWRDKSRRWPVPEVIAEYGQVGIVPAEFGCVVIDLDIKDSVNGAKNFAKAMKHVPVTTYYRTQSGGWHIWYRVPEGSDIRQHHRLDGVDIRYADGYVCFNKEYDIHYNGRLTMAEGELLRWLTAQKEQPVYPAHSTTSTVSGGNRQYDLSPIPEGRRNNTLFSWGAGLMNGVRKNELSVQDFCDLIHLRGGISGLPYFECQQIINSLLTTCKAG